MARNRTEVASSTGPKRVIFDVDGTVLFQDGAYEVFVDEVGVDVAKIYGMYYDYDDKYAINGLMGVRKRGKFQPADSLVPISFHLVARDVTHKHFAQKGADAPLIKNAQQVFTHLHENDMAPHLISAGFDPYVQALGENAGVASENIFATKYPEIQSLTSEEKTLISQIEKQLLTEGSDAETIIHTLLHESAPLHQNLKRIIAKMFVMAGDRKVRKMREITGKEGQRLDSVVYVGDGFTDARALEAVHKAGGLAIAINANKFALPWATVSVATTDFATLTPILEAWREGGRAAAIKLVQEFEANNKEGGDVFYHVVAGKNVEQIEDILQIHSALRKRVRAETAHFS